MRALVRLIGEVRFRDQRQERQEYRRGESAPEESSKPQRQ
jgi:hypothetical protein